MEQTPGSCEWSITLETRFVFESKQECSAHMKVRISSIKNRLKALNINHKCVCQCEMIMSNSRAGEKTIHAHQPNGPAESLEPRAPAEGAAPH